MEIGITRPSVGDYRHVSTKSVTESVGVSLMASDAASLREQGLSICVSGKIMNAIINDREWQASVLKGFDEDPSERRFSTEWPTEHEWNCALGRCRSGEDINILDLLLTLLGQCSGMKYQRNEHLLPLKCLLALVIIALREASGEFERLSTQGGSASYIFDGVRETAPAVVLMSDSDLKGDDASSAMSVTTRINDVFNEFKMVGEGVMSQSLFDGAEKSQQVERFGTEQTDAMTESDDGMVSNMLRAISQQLNILKHDAMTIATCSFSFVGSKR